MSFKPFRSAACSIALLLLLGCAADDASEAGVDGDNPPENVVRSETCLAMQDAYCDFVSDQCSTQPRDECESATRTIFCHADEKVQSCLDALGSATCPDFPDECRGIMDPAPAQWYCNEVVDALCTRQAACKIATRSECMANLADEVDCSTVVGASPEIDDCLTLADNLPCGAISGDGGKTVPSGCMGIFVTQ
jgi:hypothetical protein